MKTLEKYPGSVWDDVVLSVDWTIIQPGVLRQFLTGTLELLSSSQPWQPLVVSSPGVGLVEQVSVLLSIVVVRVVILVSVLLSIGVVRIVILVSITPSWSRRQEDRRQRPLKIKMRKL